MSTFKELGLNKDIILLGDFNSDYEEYIKFKRKLLVCNYYLFIQCFLGGLFSLVLSRSLATLNYFIAFFIAGLPDKSKPLGSLPSGDIFFNFSRSSELLSQHEGASIIGRDDINVLLSKKVANRRR